MIINGLVVNGLLVNGVLVNDLLSGNLHHHAAPLPRCCIAPYPLTAFVRRIFP